MRIVFHLGVHCTDEGRLVRALLRSRGALLSLGVAVPPPRHYRSLLRETLGILNGTAASAEVQELLLDVMVDAEGVSRVVLFNDSLICLPQRAISDEGLYPMAARRLATARGLFPDHLTEFHLALCNPATLVPTLAKRAGPDGYEAVMAGANLLRLRWLPTIRQVLQMNPGVQLTVWCNEDTPLIWPEVLRVLTGLAPEVALEGDNDLLATLLTPEGLAGLIPALAGLDPTDRGTRRERISAALELHGRDEEMEIDADLPGWTEQTVERVTEAYIADCAAIAILPGVTFLQP